MATPVVKKFVIVAGQSNALEVGDAHGWEDLHPYVALRRTEHTKDQTEQWTAGSYSDSYQLPFTFFGGPQRNRLGDGNFGSWQNVNVMSRAVQAVRFLTPFDPAGHYTNVGTGNATNYPGTCEIVAVPVPTGATFATNVRWQKDPVGLSFTRRRTGTTHTIQSGWSSATNTVTVSPPLVPPPEVGEQLSYEFAAGADSSVNSGSDDELILCNQFGGLQDVGSILDAAGATGAVELGKHGCTLTESRNATTSTYLPVRVNLRSRPVSVGSVVTFATATNASSYIAALGGSMSGADITGISVAPWVPGDAIVFAAGNGTLPANITEGDTYYVSSVSGNTITINTVNDGSDMDVGAGFVAGTTGPSAAAAPSLPSNVVAGTEYYVTRKATEGETLTLTASDWNASTIDAVGHDIGNEERVSFTGDLPSELTAGQVYYARFSSFSSIALSETANGALISSFTGGGDATMLREDSYGAFYISETRGGDEILSAGLAGDGNSGFGAATSVVRVTCLESYRGSLTGLQATCISGTAANVGVSRALGDVRTDATNVILKCASDWPSTPQTGDKFTIEVPPQGQNTVPFKHFAMWLPWSPFEGRAPYRGPGLATINSTSGSELFVTVAGVKAPEEGQIVRLWTSGTLPSPLKMGRKYYVHTGGANAIFLKETYDATDAIEGDDLSDGDGTHVITIHDQDQINPFPPAFNYPNHHGIPLHYQPFEGPSLISRNPRIGIAPGLGIKLHEYYGEVMNVAVCAVGGTSIGHKEIYASTTGAFNYGWLDVHQQKSWSPGESNNCFARFLDVLESIKVAFTAEGAVGECVGIVFLQGEEDGSHLPLANNYYRAATRLKPSMRQAVKDAGLLSGKAESLPWIQPKIQASPWPYASTINTAIQQMVDEDAYARTYEVSDLTLMDDGFHYDGASFSTHVDRAFAELVDLNRTGFSEVQVCNMALANLGDTGTITSISPPDGSTQAAVCAQYWDLALNTALESHNWDFSVRRTSPTAITTDRTEWLFSYELPANFAGVVSVLPEGTTDDLASNGADIRLEYAIANDGDQARRLYCNSENVVLRYNARVADSSQWSDKFTHYLSWVLSHMIAPPIFKGAKGIEAARAAAQMLEYLGQKAMSFDARKTRRKDVQSADAAWDRDSR